MNIDELIKALQEQQKLGRGKEQVYMVFPSHDYWHTNIAKPVAKVESTELKFSAYHDAMVVDDRDTGEINEEDDAAGEKTIPFITLA